MTVVAEFAIVVLLPWLSVGLAVPALDPVATALSAVLGAVGAALVVRFDDVADLVSVS